MPGVTVVATREAALIVADAMITDVKLTDARATVREVRSLFESEHVHAAVVVENGLLLTVLDRVDVLDQPDCVLATELGCLRSRVVRSDADLESARAYLLTSGRRRLAVIDDDGTFRGLLCLKRTRLGFCSDGDVLARR